MNVTEEMLEAGAAAFQEAHEQRFPFEVRLRMAYLAMRSKDHSMVGDDVREALEETFLARLQLSDHQKQLDADGVMVGVSRQALDEVLAAFEKLDAITAIGSQSIEGERG